MIVVLTGDFGTGKSSLIKTKFLKSNKSVLVYALIKKDLGENLNYEMNFEKYISKAVKMSNANFIIDEAKTAIPKEEPDAQKSQFERDIITWFVNARKCNNSIFIVYHTLREVPIWLISYTDFFLRFRTNDLLQHQKNRFISFPKIVESLEKYPTLPNFKYHEIKTR